MTFSYSSEQQSCQARARQTATTSVAPAARAVDESGVVPADVAAAASALLPATDAVCALIVAEELAAASAGVAAHVALTPAGEATLPGLRGFGGSTVAAPSAPERVTLSGIAIGIARAALAAAIDRARADGARPKGTEQTPHWVLADAATEIDAARLLALKAAQRIARGETADADAALAQSYANAAAARAVDAALRILGPEGYRQGTTLERLTRDQRAVSLLTGTEEEPRAVAAAGLLPQ